MKEKKEAGSSKNSSGFAERKNQGKPKFSLVDLRSLEPCARVMEFGAEKYSRNNWKKGFKLSDLLDSMLRHASALQDGEWIDPESGLPHIGHLQCNALFMGCKNNVNDLCKEKYAKKRKKRGKKRDRKNIGYRF